MKTPDVINIVSATRIGDYQLRLRFDDGSGQDIDFKPFLTQSRHPDIHAFLNPERFGAFRVEHGDLVWGDHELCFPVIDLYRNQILHGELQGAAA